MFMNEQEWNNTFRGIISDLQAGLPKVSGQMTRKTIGYSMWGQEIIGEIVIDVPYAQFVNTGFDDHPNSKKLERDYHIVERLIENSIKARMEGVLSNGNK